MEYTKKVMKCFLKPRNVGKIDNADAIGELKNDGCGDVMRVYLKIGEKGKQEYIKDIKFQTLGCLPPEEQVLVNEGDWVDVGSVAKGSEVLNSAGERTKVVENYVRDYNGTMLTVIPFISTFNSFSVTTEHPVLCIKRALLKKSRKTSSKSDWLHVNEEELLSTNPDFVEASNLEIGDYLVYVPNNRIKDSSDFSNDLMKLLGYYLSEGYTCAKDSVLNFSFNKNENKEIDEVKALSKRIMGKEGSQRTRKNVTELRICSSKGARLFIKLAGKYATQKKLSPEILVLPFEKQWEMIETYIKGDGNLYKRRKKDSTTYRISTSSKELAIQIQEILARGKILASIKKDNRIRENHHIEGRKVSVNPSYEISFKLERKHKFYYSKSKYILVPIRNIVKRDYSGKVYNFQVAGEPAAYLVKGFAVHNCPAAIASSDVLCTLAKGKTIQQALKISDKDIVKKLGGLPQIKLHCSVMGKATLKDAIDKYKLKGGK